MQINQWSVPVKCLMQVLVRRMCHILGSPTEFSKNICKKRLVYNMITKIGGIHAL